MKPNFYSVIYFHRLFGYGSKASSCRCVAERNQATRFREKMALSYDGLRATSGGGFVVNRKGLGVADGLHRGTALATVRRGTHLGLKAGPTDIYPEDGNFRGLGQPMKEDAEVLDGSDSQLADQKMDDFAE